MELYLKICILIELALMNVWGIANMNRVIPALYTNVVKPFVNPYVWKIDSKFERNMYEKYTGNTHLEIGGGPNPYLHKKQTQVHFLDINLENLMNIQQKYKHPAFKVHFGSLMNKEDYPDTIFSSVSCVNVMHCIPEYTKWTRLYYNTNSVLEEGGILFGSYINNETQYSRILNIMGVFHNIHDNTEFISKFAKPYFDIIEIIKRNNSNFFILRKKKREVHQLASCILSDLRTKSHHNDHDLHLEQQYFPKESFA